MTRRRNTSRKEQAAQEFADEIGVELGEYISEGAWGEVFAVADHPGYVIKATSDPAEYTMARNAHRLFKEGKSGGLVEVYDYRRYYDDPEDMYSGITVMLVERLQRSQSSPLVKVFEHVLVRDIVKAEVMPRMPQRFDEAKGYWRPDNDGFAAAWTWTYAAAANLKAIHDSCKAAGMTAHNDWKLDNVLYRPGWGLVLSDMGCCTVKPL